MQAWERLQGTPPQQAENMCQATKRVIPEVQSLQTEFCHSETKPEISNRGSWETHKYVKSKEHTP